MLDKKEIGKNLERARLKVGLSKGRFAKIAGVDASQYGRVERGEEGLGRENLLSIAEKHGVNVDFLSTGKGPVLIKDVNKSITDAGPEVIPVIPELTQAQVISILAGALKDQADAFKAQAELMKSIESKMAREDTQAKIEEKIKEVFEATVGSNSNLTYVLAAVKKISIRQDSAMKEIHEGLLSIQSDKTDLSQDEGSRSDRNGVDGEKRGKHRAKRK